MTSKSKEEAIKLVQAKVLENMMRYGSWAYSTVLALQDTLDMKDDTLLKASGALTGGIGGLADTCGSMIGATLILGAVCGRGRQEVDNGMQKLAESIKRAADFYRWFKDEAGAVTCRDIVTGFGNGVFYDFGDPAQAKAAFEAGVAQKCVQHVQKIATKAVEILYDELLRWK